METLAELGRLTPDADGFDQCVTRLAGLLRKHVAHEDLVFARLREQVPDSERARLGRRVEAAVKRVRARKAPAASRKSRTREE